MNNERLAELKERAEKATKLAALIEDLRKTRSDISRWHISDRCGNECGLVKSVQQEVILGGIDKLIADSEALLESLLNPLPPADQMPAPFIPAIDPLPPLYDWAQIKPTIPLEITNVPHTGSPIPPPYAEVWCSDKHHDFANCGL